MLGGNISAQEAREWGLVGKVVEQGELDGAVDSWVRELDMASPAAVRAQKFMMNDWEEMGGVEERIQTSVDWFERAWKTRAKDGLPEPASIMTRWMKEKAKKKGGS